MKLLRRLLPLIILLGFAVVVRVSGVLDQFSLDGLRQNELALREWVGANYALALLAFLAVYALMAAACIPLNVVRALAGGLLFGPVVGALAVIAGATLGAVGTYYAVRIAIGAPLVQAAERRGGALRRIIADIRRNSFSYVLSARLAPIFPNWLINIAGGLAAPPLAPYAAGNAIGVIPAAFVYAGLGFGLREAFAAGQSPDLKTLARPELLWPLMGLALLALVPVLVSRLRRRGA